MQPGNPYHLIEAVGSCQVGSVWSAIDPQGRSLMVALLDPNVATDPRWRQAFQEAANALVQAGEPGYLYADFTSTSPWVAYSAENGVGAERVFLALGMDFQPVPPDGLGPLDHAPFEPTTQVTPATHGPPTTQGPPTAPATPGATPAQDQPLPPGVIGTTTPAEAPPTAVFPPIQPGPPAAETPQPVAAPQSPAAPRSPAAPQPAAAQPPATEQPAPPAPDVPADDFEETQPTQRIQVPPTAPPAPVNPWANTSAPQSAPPVPPQPAPVSPPPVSSTPPRPTSAAPHPVSGAPTSVPPHPTSVPPHPTSGGPGPVSGAPMSPAFGQPLSPAYGQPQSPAYGAPAYGPRPPQGPAPYDPYAPVSQPPRRSRTGLWIGIAVAVLVLIAGGGGVYAWTASGSDDPAPPTASPSESLATAPLPTASPLYPGLEPPRKGTWPAQWPKFAATDTLRTMSNPEGLGFTLKVPRTWDCTPAGRAEGFAKYNCGVAPGTNPQIGGELIVRTCPDGCSEEQRTTMRQAEEAWGMQWVQSGEFSTYAESSSLQIDGARRYALVVVAYWRSGSEGAIDRQLVFRMTAPVEGAGQLRRVANYIRDTVIF